MSWTSMFAMALLLLLVGLVAYWLFFTKPSDDDGVVILAGSQSGKDTRTYTVTTPVSLNQPEGITYTYTGWMYVNDFTTGFGRPRKIFSHTECPGVYIDSTSNALLVYVDTYGAKDSVLIPNIPAKKWVHIGIVVNQTAVDIYINGILRQHHTLSQLPKQSTSAIECGGGWDGVLGRLKYYARSLSNAEMSVLASQPPPDDLLTHPSAPQYLDMSWYTGRLNSA